MNIKDEFLNAWAKVRGHQPEVAQASQTTASEPFRAELFSAEQMAQHGKALAQRHQIYRRQRHKNPLLPRLTENERLLHQCREQLLAALAEQATLAPAAEWLLDNFYLIDEQILIARQHLPRQYSRELPLLSQGSAAGLPRVYALALEIIAHGDGRIDLEQLSQFVEAYQSQTPLLLGELWAIPIMLRLALIENLRQVANRVRLSSQDRQQGRRWAKMMQATVADSPKNLILSIADMARSQPPMNSAFVAEFSRQLQGQTAALALASSWIEQHLAEAGLSVEQMLLQESQQQAADQASVSNSINSLRALSAIDWQAFVESVSQVEHLLQQDPAGVYPRMDFETRDRYRRAIDQLAKHSPLSESDIAQVTLSLAQSAPASGSPDRDLIHTHVGYYLIDRGRPQLAARIGYRPTLAERCQQRMQQAPVALYLGSVLTLTALLSGLLSQAAHQHGLSGLPWAVFVLLAWLVLSQVTAVLINGFSMIWITPKRLPRLDFRHGIPNEQRTLVVIPCLLSSSAHICRLLDDLEVRFLGNSDPNLWFALLTDFPDADAEHQPADAALLEQVQQGIEQLNVQYRASGLPAHFLLLHRPRRWDPVERVWMGHERKRGKLADLNAWLQGKAEPFSIKAGDAEALYGTQYVITLDTDTKLPRDSARELVATMAHPLNRPRQAPGKHRITDGYGLLQPRMAADLAGSRSRYARLFGAEAGLDPYTRSVSDLYQDLFDEGSFIGKGIYCLATFEQQLQGRLPDNRILSHDLLEGCYVRSGLISDVQLYEESPNQYLTDVKRRERWIRGDWQIASWLGPVVPGFAGQRHANPLSALSRWKIFDNLARSLTPSALLVLLLLGWLMTAQVGFWTGVVLAMLFVPAIVFGLVSLLRKPEQLPLPQHLHLIAQATGRSLSQCLFRLACLPHEAVYSLEAILKSSGRMLITGRHLLEWTAYEADTASTGSLSASYLSLWPAPVVALLTTISLLLANPAGLLTAAPVLLLWLSAPALAWYLSQPLPRLDTELSPEAHALLHRLSRKTWAFFDQHLGPQDNWLPPDNLQLQPGPVLAHRTSPTNIGLALLANLSAYDLGYLSAGRLLERTQHTLTTLLRLERHRGHFFNWYDTLTLLPLPPRYISTVDSGNLLGHLKVLRMGLLQLKDAPLVNPQLFAGLRDTLLVVQQSLDAPERSQTASALREPIAELQQRLATLASTDLTLAQIGAELAQLLQQLEPLCATPLTTSDTDSEPGFWLNQLQQQIRAHQQDLNRLCPWLATPSGTGPNPLPELDRQSMPSLSQYRQWAQQQAPAEAQAADAHWQQIEQLSQQIDALTQVDHGFLYDGERHLLAIGYNLDSLRRDHGFYDLLASEARLCHFIAIAQGQLPQKSWFALGRRRAASPGTEPVLMSWSGSMFEYLMPALVMPSYPGSLLDQSCRAAIAAQKLYGQQQKLPWGVSESGYYQFDAAQNYQYHAFGVPNLGFKRGLSSDRVVAPYASVMALIYDPAAACANLQQLSRLGLEGRYGFYEAIDYTSSRLPRGQSSQIVQSFMVHHQGMSLLALVQHRCDQPMQRRFEADPELRATLLLLQERIPKNTIIHQQDTEPQPEFHRLDLAPVQQSLPADTPYPEVQLLSNGSYQLMLTNAGGGYSRWRDLALTRWREDTSCDNWGSFIYLRDLEQGHYWSNTHQPTLQPADSYQALFSEGRAEYRRREHGIETYSEIVVSPEDDIELRRVRLTNHSRSTRHLELTSYLEVVLGAQAADQAQSAFNKLFVQTEILSAQHALLASRRPRSSTEATPWMFHLLSPNGYPIEEVSYETDRLKFIGRGRTLQAPQSLLYERPLSGSAGSVLDPVFAIRCRIRLKPGQSMSLDFITGAADQREQALQLIQHYQDRHFANRALKLASTQSIAMLRQLNASEADAVLYRRLASAVLYAQPRLRADASILLQNRRGQSGLWGYAISGDLPIVLLKIAQVEQLELARQLIQCHGYWRLKGLKVDLVIWNDDQASYRQNLQDQLLALVSTGTEANLIDKPGGTFIRVAEQIPHDDRILLQAVARLLLSDRLGSLSEQLNRASRRLDKPINWLKPLKKIRRSESAAPEHEPWQFGHSLGGFSRSGHEYQIQTDSHHRTPLPWVNVLANPDFGSVLTESGLSYSWSDNAHEFRLSPWSDDPVGSQGGECYYLRDEDTGHYWSPTPLPCPGTSSYLTRHGFGYSRFLHQEDGLDSELCIYVDLERQVKFSVLRIQNRSDRLRRVSATGYVEWVLGDLRSKTALHLTTEVDAQSGALFARNPYHSEFGHKVGFFDVDEPTRTLTCDRSEFLGRYGSIAQPEALKRAGLSGRVGAGLDPCAALQVYCDLLPGEERQFIFRLGAAPDQEQARALATSLRTPGTAEAALARVEAYWQETLTSVQVSSPDASLDLLANGWLLYQALACRIWARSGFYQSGGAFGFRDQLQDCMALVHSRPELLREHLLRCAAHQYPEGDVQHWWHPPHHRGVRTRCSDDYLWLPVATCRYLQATQDRTVLDEMVPFIEGRPLAEHEESYYDLPLSGHSVGSLYQHCQRALRHGLRYGPHGLPLIGSGDWNDGMNLVGIDGVGESVWLGFFLYDALNQFADLASFYQDPDFATFCRQEAAQLAHNLEQSAWDGDWYQRAWFDDGTPLGSKANTECRIDSISQSWAVLSGAGSRKRARIAMESLNTHLVRRDKQIVQLLEPPFDQSDLNPGYIKGYVPGVRENGGQYTHAAVWAAMAFAALPDPERAWTAFGLINPINHCLNDAAIDRYKAEPYVVAADVYGVDPHIGRGGWSWYTGSAGLLYRLILESLLGLKRVGNSLEFRPCVPADWQHYQMTYRFGGSLYRLAFERLEGSGRLQLELDGQPLSDTHLPLTDDGREHQVVIRFG